MTKILKPKIVRLWLPYAPHRRPLRLLIGLVFLVLKQAK